MILMYSCKDRKMLEKGLPPVRSCQYAKFMNNHRLFLLSSSEPSSPV